MPPTKRKPRKPTALGTPWRKYDFGQPLASNMGILLPSGIGTRKPITRAKASKSKS